jgi:hypothetical protein
MTLGWHLRLQPVQRNDLLCRNALILILVILIIDFCSKYLNPCRLEDLAVKTDHDPVSGKHSGGSFYPGILTQLFTLSEARNHYRTACQPFQVEGSKSGRGFLIFGQEEFR